MTVYQFSINYSSVFDKMTVKGLLYILVCYSKHRGKQMTSSKYEREIRFLGKQAAHLNL